MVPAGLRCGRQDLRATSGAGEHTALDFRLVEFTDCALGSLRRTRGKISQARFNACKLLEIHLATWL